MSDKVWRPGDRALLPVTLAEPVTGLSACVWSDAGGAVWPHVVYAADLIPDTRRPSWLPGQPGDVAEWDGQRWMRGRRWWWVDDEDFATHSMSDDDVPADSVLVLPAKTREAQ
jgi:hypothetical protein